MPAPATLKPDFKGVRAFVTGHTGFKGSWLCEWLAMDGAQLTGLALPPEEGERSLFHETGLAGRMRSTLGDIRDYDVVRGAMEAARPEIVFHLAAQPLVRRSYADPLGTFATNVQGTAHVLEAARQCASVRAIVCVTSDKCYENREWERGYREDDALGGKDPYSASKGAAEIVAHSYRRAIYPQEGRVRLATARGGNVVGGGDWSEDRLIPDLARAMRAGQPLVLRNPGAVRPWQHVLELVRGYATLGARLMSAEDASAEGAWNFGPRAENEVTVREIVERFVAAWDGAAGFAVKVEPSPLLEAHTLKLDIAKAEAELRWRPQLSFDETANLTAAWYRAHAESPAKAYTMMREQIAAYRA